MAAKRRNFKKRQPRVNQVKKLVTGQGPTLLERLAAQSNNIGTVAKAILPIAMAINTEEKYFDIASNFGAYLPGTNDSLTNLSGPIAQGLTDVTRIGNSILMKSVNFNATVGFTASTTISTGISRVVLLIWKDNNQDNAPSVAKILETPSDINSRFNKDYTDQFVVLKDKYFTHQSPNAIAQEADVKHMKLYKKLDFHMRFDGATVNDSTVNHLMLLFQGSAAAIANQSTLRYYVRFNYTDN